MGGTSSRETTKSASKKATTNGNVKASTKQAKVQNGDKSTKSSKTKDKKNGKSENKKGNVATEKYRDEEHGLTKIEEAIHRSPIGFAVASLSSRILITVFIGVPYALKEAGFGLGILLVLVIAFLTDYTLRLLIQAAEMTGKDTYIEVVRAVYGKFGVMGIIFKQFLFPFIILVASNVIIADVLQKIVILIADENDITGIEEEFYGRREFIISMATLLITFPISLAGDQMARLGKWAAGSLLFLFLVLVFAIVRLASLDIPDTPDAYGFADIDVGRAIGILIAAYMCQHSSFLIFHAMIKPTEHRMKEVTHISCAVSLLFMLAFGIVGYATFTQDTQGNILNNYCTDDTLMNVARILFIISIILAYPGEVEIARSVVEHSVFLKRQPAPLWRYVLVTFLIIAASVGFSFLTDCLSIMLELNGVTNAAPLAFVFPPMLVMKLRKKQDNLPIISKKNVPLIMVLLIGISVTGFGVYLSIKTIIDGVKCSHGAEPAYCNSTFINSTIV